MATVETASTVFAGQADPRAPRWDPAPEIAAAWAGDALKMAQQAEQAVTGFEIRYRDTYKDVCDRTTSPPQRSVLYQCGTTPPRVSDLDPGYCSSTGGPGDGDLTGDEFCATYNTGRGRRRQLPRVKRCRRSTSCQYNFESRRCAKAQNSCAAKQVRRRCKQDPTCSWTDGTGQRKPGQGTCAPREGVSGGGDAPASPSDVRFFSIPLPGLATDSSTPAAFLQELDLLGRAEALPSLIVSPCAQAMEACGGGLEEAPPSSFAGTPAERVAAAKKFTALFTDSADEKITNLVAFPAYLEQTPVKKASWLKFLAAFFNVEDAANAQLRRKEAAYKAKKVETAALAKQKGKAPTVAWVSYNEAGFGSPATIKFSFAAYKVVLTADGGGRMLNPSRTEFKDAVESGGSAGRALSFYIEPAAGAKDPIKCDRPECMTLAEARAKTRALLQGVDVIIEESYRAGPDFKPKVLTGADINSFYGFGSDSTVPTPPAVTNEKVFTLDGIVGPSGAQDWFESAMVLPAKVLSDFARAAHDLRTGDGRMWFRNVYKGEQPKVQTASLCAAREKATLCPTPTIAPIPSPAV